MSYSVRVTLYVALFLLFVGAHHTVAFSELGDLARISVNPENLLLVDQHGRTRLFHGVNAVFKQPPFHPIVDHFDPQLSLCEEDMKNLQAWGFNVIRLGVMWPGVEPTRAHYNETYLEVMTNIIKLAAKYNIYCIVDCHQDLLSRKFCGEGVPDWAAYHSPEGLPFPRPAVNVTFALDPSSGYPSLKECHQYTFARYYLSDQVGRAFQSFYDDVNGTRTSFTAFWKTLATRFRELNSVLGYELLNEPWNGDYLEQPDLLVIPGLADKRNLQPLYSELNSAIRSVDENHIVFFEPIVSDYYWETGLETGPGGKGASNEVYSYHIYCQLLDQNGQPKNIGFCNKTDLIQYNVKQHDLGRLRTGGMMTEFGSSNASPISQESLTFVTDQADRTLQSWAYWQFKDYNDLTTTGGESESFYFANGTLNIAKVKVLSRTYAQAINGVPTQMSFNRDSGRFELSYVVDQAAQPANVEIFVNHLLHYPNGVHVTCSQPSARVEILLSQNLIRVWMDDAASKDGQSNTIIVTAN
mmetsp:Transcript_25536/g.64093  ORF Transcript_25536/g.64093 Transcript_25536/m.64093 type:complete len:525 (-) Transcript_25536:47-1621(-)|eukprot:CAMPEP_0177648896 /NCGR_PEP_ID=MMETSP0447-20121125/11078_1 /TAXON_ID=0 /ORGANISM="Stygamoeba regulata, Strain BSH-02190019" /LENGTH=524 /DNA_ID=CAMNT_0019151579 /DNA_START=81 /DNA_END=1658 /DNA_ORIENTATION=+